MIWKRTQRCQVEKVHDFDDDVRIFTSFQLWQEPIWSVQLPYSVCETAFSQVGLFLD